jgi:hypothetical protein
MVYEQQVTAQEARAALDEHIVTAEIAELGIIATRTDIESTIGPFHHAPHYQTRYPQVVVDAIGDLYREYNGVFSDLVAANTEWPTDYQYARRGPRRAPINGWVQIDMVGLPQGFLDRAEEFDREVTREALRPRIFEIENSLANYQLLGRIHAHPDRGSCFDRQFRQSLDEVRQATGKQVALLATTDEKYEAIKASEFGKSEAEPVSADEVRRLSGFDRFFDPTEFLEYVRQTGDELDYVLYVRSSDPIAKLREPGMVVETPLLEDDETRRIIRAHAVTLNIDRPDLPLDSEQKINDTKAYMLAMEMARRVDRVDDVYVVGEGDSAVVTVHPELEAYLRAQGMMSGGDESSGNLARSHAKPMQAAYGCYGHVTLQAYNKSERRRLKTGLQQRGPYVVQPEIVTPVITNASDGQSYTYIDRNFFSTDGTTYRFMGGFRSLMPISSAEAEKGRVHGNSDLVWAEIC